MDARKFALFLLGVAVSVSPVSDKANALVNEGTAQPKTFAVFIVSSNGRGRAIGGVAGTAFFISNTDAITAYHVLQPASFEVPRDFDQRRVWLVHENEPAIALEPSEVAFDAKNDLTRIHLDSKKQIATKFVYKRGVLGEFQGPVTTDGFRANSIGPELAWGPSGVEIVSVPKLERVSLSGEVLLRSRVELKATDVTLEGTPCILVSYEPIRGISGGPLLQNGKVIGMNSFADPSGYRKTWAVEQLN